MENPAYSAVPCVCVWFFFLRGGIFFVRRKNRPNKKLQNPCLDFQPLNWENVSGKERVDFELCADRQPWDQEWTTSQPVLLLLINFPRKKRAFAEVVVMDFQKKEWAGRKILFWGCAVGPKRNTSNTLVWHQSVTSFQPSVCVLTNYRRSTQKKHQPSPVDSILEAVFIVSPNKQ